MPSTHKPRSGSLQFWPRNRAKRQYPRVKAWSTKSKTTLKGFIGYKAGMTTVLFYDRRKSAMTKEQIATAATIVECPSLKPFALRFYKKTPYGLKTISQILAKNLDKELKKRVNLPKKEKKTEIPEKYDEAKIIVYTQPKQTGIGKKKPEIMEILVQQDKKGDLQKLLDSEIKVSDVFKEQEFVDIHAVTTGRGFQGAVRRFGIGLRQKKSEKGRRGPGSLGAWTPKKVSWKTAQPGQYGYHTRTEHNKLIFKIGEDGKDITPKSGLSHYGVIKNSYLLIKGSIPGPVKRMIRLNHSIRQSSSQQIEVAK